MKQKLPSVSALVTPKGDLSDSSSVIREDLPLADVLPRLAAAGRLAVENKQGEIVGSLDAGDALLSIHQAYRRLEAFFETLIQTVDASITAVDEEGRTAVWTAGAEQIFSIPKEQILGHPIDDFFSREMLRCMETLRSGESLYHHFHQARSDLFVLINSKPVVLDGEIIGAVVSETDVTSQVRLNQELFQAVTKVHHLEKEIAKWRPSVDPFSPIKGKSPAIQHTIEMITKISTTKATALILGESGVGKELFAKALHQLREGADAPFIPINCGAIPPSLFESELFGYEKGAFSGADLKGKKGKIELAQGGTLFLDEVGELPLEMQVKLLRVLQEKTYYPVGGTKLLQADFRLIAATNRDLEAMVRSGQFREDLYYRLNVVSVNVPPLRSRKEDLLELAHYFLHEFGLLHQREIKGLPHTVLQDLMQYEWPGNIRELRNTMERLVVLSTDGVIKREDLPFFPAARPVEQEQEPPQRLADLLEAYERQVLAEALLAAGGNKAATAERLGISRATLYNKLNRLGLLSLSAPDATR